MDLPVVNVLFVCLGNICRSPTAEAVLAAASVRDGLGERLRTDSAGTHVWHGGLPPDRRAREVARARGLELGHLRARRVRVEDFRRFDYVVAMDRSNLENLAAICPDSCRDRLFLLLDFVDGGTLGDVPDPFGGPRDAFERTFDLIEAGVEGLLAHIRAKHFDGGTGDAAPDPELLIFDCDGVLVDSEPIAARVLAEAASEAGLPLTAADCIERYTGISLDGVIRSIEAELGRPLPADFRARLGERDRAAFTEDLRAVDGVAEAIARLPWPRCVASSGSQEKMRFTLGLTGLLPLFEPHLFSATEVARGKPAPDLFLLAAERMGVNPAGCLVIEDAVPGIVAARAAGMRVFGFVGGGHRRSADLGRLREAGAEQVFAKMADLPGRLGIAATGANGDLRAQDKGLVGMP